MQKFKSICFQVTFTIIIAGFAAGLGFYQGIKSCREEEKKTDTMEIISKIESNHNPNAVSPAGARGQYQVMRPTWDECTELMGVDWDYDTDWKDPVKNKAVGEYYFYTRIPDMLKAYKVPVNIETQLACYNGGIGRVVKAWRKDSQNWKQYLPTETRNYIVKYAAAK